MRLILSTILAAALVFFGTLLFAGYFDGIEGPSGQQPEQVSPQPPDSDTRPTVWHCPKVEQILSEPLPEIFIITDEQHYELSSGFQWLQVNLSHAYGVSGTSAKGREITCTYNVRNSVGDGQVPGAQWTLSLVAHLDGEIQKQTESWLP